LLEELEANDDKNDHNDDEPTPQPSSKNKEKNTKQAMADDSHVIKGKLLARGLEFGHRRFVAVAGGISVDLQLGTKTEPADDKQDRKTGATANDKSKQTKGAMTNTDHFTTLVVPLAPRPIPRFRYHATRIRSRGRRHDILWRHITRNFWTKLTSAAM